MDLERFKPTASRRVLVLFAGLAWVGAGAATLRFAFRWLRGSVQSHLLFVVVGVLASLAIHHFGFLRLVDKNLTRLRLSQGKRCLFSFFTWKSYLIIAVMMTMGAGLRHSGIPKDYLAVVYLGIGLALLLSSVRYLRCSLFPRSMC